MITFKKIYNKPLKAGILFSDTTDHLPVFLAIGKIPIRKQGPKYTRIHSEVNVNKFLYGLNDLNLNHIFEIQNTDEAYKQFIEPYC